MTIIIWKVGNIKDTSLYLILLVLGFEKVVIFLSQAAIRQSTVFRTSHSPPRRQHVSAPPQGCRDQMRYTMLSANFGSTLGSPPNWLESPRGLPKGGILIRCPTQLYWLLTTQKGSGSTFAFWLLVHTYFFFFQWLTEAHYQRCGLEHVWTGALITLQQEDLGNFSTIKPNNSFTPIFISKETGTIH